jgi:hypothetical protein
MKPNEPQTWGNWLYSGWSDEQWNPVIGVECSGMRCNSLRLLTYNKGMIQGSLKSGDFYDTDVFSDPHNWKGLDSKVECKKDHIVTRVWCAQAFCDNLKLRCTKLKHLNWCTRETCDGDYRYWTEILSNEDRKVDRSVRTCKPGTVVIGMECIDTYFCDRKRLLCEAITPPSRHVSSWWQLHQVTGGESADIYSMTQTSEAVSEHIFGTEDTWSIEVEGKIEGTFKDMIKGSLTMTYKYEHKTFEELKSAYSESLTSEHIRMCEPKCREEGKNGFLWMTRVDLVDKTNTSLTPVDPQLGYFQSIPQCFVQCVSKGKEPKCPPKYCEDDDCQCCSESMKDALIDYFPACQYLSNELASAAVHQHYCCQFVLLFPALLGVLAGIWQRSI